MKQEQPLKQEQPQDTQKQEQLNFDLADGLLLNIQTAQEGENTGAVTVEYTMFPHTGAIETARRSAKLGERPTIPLSTDGIAQHFAKVIGATSEEDVLKIRDLVDSAYGLNAKETQPETNIPDYKSITINGITWYGVPSNYGNYVEHQNGHTKRTPRTRTSSFDRPKFTLVSAPETPVTGESMDRVLAAKNEYDEGLQLQFVTAATLKEIARQKAEEEVTQQTTV